MSTSTRTICPFCGMGCSLLVRGGQKSPFYCEEATPTIDYDSAGSINRGSLCAKGNMVLELLRHPRRLESPMLRENGRMRRASWSIAFDKLADRLASICQRNGPDAVGILVGPYLTEQEARLAARLARQLGTKNLDMCQPEDQALLAGIDLAPSSPRAVRSVQEIESMTAMLVVGDIFTLSPCLAKPLLKARYDRRRNILAVLDSAVFRTGWFGKPMLTCLPGREAAALALGLKIVLQDTPGKGVEWLAEAGQAFERHGVHELEAMSGLRASDLSSVVASLKHEPESGIFFSSAFGVMERADLAAGLAALLAEATGSRFLAMTAGPNAGGVRRALREEGFAARDGHTAAEMVEAAVTGGVKGLIALDCDPLALLPGRIPQAAAAHLDLLAVAAPLPGETTAAAHLIFPSQAWGEKSGSVRNAFCGEEALEVAISPPGAARSVSWMLEEMMGLLDRPSADRIQPQVAAGGSVFFEELELWLKMDRRRRGRSAEGGHLLLPRQIPSHAADGWLTRYLSWPRHEHPQALVFLPPAFADALGIRDGEQVIVRSGEGEAVLRAQAERRVPQGVVMVSSHHPEMRRLKSWRIDPFLRDLDLRPEHVSVERAEGAGNG